MVQHGRLRPLLVSSLLTQAIGGTNGFDDDHEEEKISHRKDETYLAYAKIAYLETPLKWILPFIH
jgi:hypothetical protein